MKTNLLLLFLFLLLIHPPFIMAQESVNILVDVLEASEKPGDIDPGLAYIRQQIQRSPFRYRTYRNLASAFRTIPLGKNEVITFILPQKLSIEIIPKRLEKRTVLLGIKVWDGKKLILRSDISLARKGTVMIGAPISARRALIFAISEGF